MTKLTVYLDKTTKMQFVKWVNIYCAKIWMKGQPYKEKFDLHYPTSSLSPEFTTYIDISATWTWMADKTEIKYPITDIIDSRRVGNAINIGWLEIGERMKVTISHVPEDWILRAVFDLLVAIAEDWQETRGVIGDYVKEQEKRYGVTVDMSHFPANLRPVDTVGTESKSPKDKVKRPNLQMLERATIWRHLSPFIKSLNGRPTAKVCIAKIKEYPGYKKEKITRQRMERILSEGYSNAYEDILKNLR
jgi:hypothetical protein